jgi:hypothetical protein
MSRSAVKDILQQIDALTQRERARLERELDARAEAEWTRLARKARTLARTRRITQATIDRAVEDVRYGRSRRRSFSTPTSMLPKHCSGAAPSA